MRHKIYCEASADRDALVTILAKNGYTVRIGKEQKTKKFTLHLLHRVLEGRSRLKKKNWQKTPDEKAIHQQAVKIRKMTDQQIVERLENSAEVSADQRRAVINEALDAIAVRDENGDRVSDITIRKIRKILQGKGLL